MEASAVSSGEAVPHARARTARKPKKDRTPWYMWVAVAAIVVFCLFPFYSLINISLKGATDLLGSSLVPRHPTLSNYSAIFKNPDFTASLRNSAIVAGITTALALVVGSFCAYALARLRIRGKFIILGIVLSITTFPQI